MKMFKKDGKTAVLVSTGFGAGFSTWNKKEMAVDFDLVEGFMKGGINKLECIAEEKQGEDIYLGGTHNIEIKWVDEGKKFQIREYDGAESIVEFNEEDWFTA